MREPCGDLSQGSFFDPLLVDGVEGQVQRQDIDAGFAEETELSCLRVAGDQGTNLRFELRFAEGDDSRRPALARELAALEVDVVVTDGKGVYSARQATSTIPIVMCAAADIVGSPCNDIDRAAQAFALRLFAADRAQGLQLARRQASRGYRAESTIARIRVEMRSVDWSGSRKASQKKTGHSGRQTPGDCRASSPERSQPSRSGARASETDRHKPGWMCNGTGTFPPLPSHR